MIEQTFHGAPYNIFAPLILVKVIAPRTPKEGGLSVFLYILIKTTDLVMFRVSRDLL